MTVFSQKIKEYRDVKYPKSFEPGEMVMYLCGFQRKWDYAMIKDGPVMRPNHGQPRYKIMTIPGGILKEVGYDYLKLPEFDDHVCMIRWPDTCLDNMSGKKSIPEQMVQATDYHVNLATYFYASNILIAHGDIMDERLDVKWTVRFKIFNEPVFYVFSERKKDYLIKVHVKNLRETL